MSIVEFLLARLEEDEALARSASPGPWHVDAESTEVLAVDGIVVADGFALSGPQTRATTAHIARHDPARVLADCAAKRQVISTVVSWRHDTVEDCWYSCGMTYDTDVEDACCNEASTGRCTCGLEYRQRQLLQPLASVYADHPDFDPEWRALYLECTKCHEEEQEAL